MPRPKGNADLLEDRRRRALALCDKGLSLNEVARSNPMRRQFRAAVVPGTAARRTRRLAGPLFARTPAEAGTDPAPALAEVAAPGA